MEFTLTGKELSAQEAPEWDIVIRVVLDDDHLLEEAAELAQQLATGRGRPWEPQSGCCTTTGPETLETQMEHETRALTDISHTADTREGISAFTGKRVLSFEGGVNRPRVHRLRVHRLQFAQPQV